MKAKFADVTQTVGKWTLLTGFTLATLFGAASRKGDQIPIPVAKGTVNTYATVFDVMTGDVTSATTTVASNGFIKEEIQIFKDQISSLSKGDMDKYISRAYSHNVKL